MTGKELERMIESMSSLSASDLDVRGRVLRRSKLVPSGARGPHAPDYEPEHIAKFLLACAVTNEAPESALMAMEYGALVPCDAGSAAVLGGSLASALTKLVGDPELTRSVLKVRVCQSHPVAQIVWTDRVADGGYFVRATEADLFFPPNSRMKPEDIGLGTVNTWSEIGRDVFHQIQRIQSFRRIQLIQSQEDDGRTMGAVVCSDG